jgi:hypothetical protein
MSFTLLNPILGRLRGLGKKHFESLRPMFTILYLMDTVLCHGNLLDRGLIDSADPCSLCGFRKVKRSHKKRERKKEIINCFEELDVLSTGFLLNWEVVYRGLRSKK